MTPQIAKEDGFGIRQTGPETGVRVQIKAGDPIPPGVHTDVSVEETDATPYRNLNVGTAAVDQTIGQHPQDAAAQAERTAQTDVSKLARPDAARSETDSAGSPSGSSSKSGNRRSKDS